MMCFIYTPVSWFTFDGLAGCTPFLTILFAVLIILFYQRGLQALLLVLYFALVAGLTVYWLAAVAERLEPAHIAIHLIGYATSAVLISYFLRYIKNKNGEISSRLKDHSIRDELTGLYNRRAIDQILDIEEKRYTDKKADYMVMMLDIDRFKNLNDAHGHNVGDAVLKDLAEHILDGIRTTDFAVRFGGDEFLLVLSDTGGDSAQQVFDRIDTVVHEMSGYGFPVTVSTGGAQRSECTARTELVILADQRMYDAKKRRYQQ